MENEKLKLTSSNIKYLLILYTLDDKGNGVRCAALADMLGVSRPSAHRMILSLEKKALVWRMENGIVSFTKSGRVIAKQYSRYFFLLCQYLHKILPLQTDIKLAAMALFSGMPAEQIALLCQSIEKQRSVASYDD